MSVLSECVEKEHEDGKTWMTERERERVRKKWRSIFSCTNKNGLRFLFYLFALSTMSQCVYLWGYFCIMCPIINWLDSCCSADDCEEDLNLLVPFSSRPEDGRPAQRGNGKNTRGTAELKTFLVDVVHNSWMKGEHFDMIKIVYEADDDDDFSAMNSLLIIIKLHTKQPWISRTAWLIRERDGCVFIMCGIPLWKIRNSPHCEYMNYLVMNILYLSWLL